jgi:hypothetical protein
MGRSRITRTFHNKPVSKDIKVKSSPRLAQEAPKQQASHLEEKRNIETIKRSKTGYNAFGQGQFMNMDADDLSTYNGITGRRLTSKIKTKPNSKGLIPQAHAQESAPIPVNPQGKYGTIESTENQIHGEKWGSFGFTINKTGSPHGRNVKIRKSTRADGVADTTVISKYTNLDTEKYTKEPTPLGLFAQGVGNQAYDIGGSVHELATGQDYQVKSILNRSLEHAFAGDWDSAGKVISDNPYRFAGNVATEAGLAIIPFGMVARGAGIAGRVGSAASKVSKGLGKTKGKRKAIKAIKQEEKRIGRKFTKNERRNIMDETPTVKDVQKKTLTEVAKGDTNYSYWGNAYNKRSNIGAKFSFEGKTDPIKSSSSHVHKRITTLDQAYIQKGLPGSKIPSEFVQMGEFTRLRKATGLPGNQSMMMSSKYPVPNSVINRFNKGQLVRGNDGKKVKSLFYYKSQFTPANPFEQF